MWIIKKNKKDRIWLTNMKIYDKKNSIFKINIIFIHLKII